jgi:hypothetical protein
MNRAEYQREWRRKRGIISLGAEILCSRCFVSIIKTSPKKEFCDSCALFLKNEREKIYWEKKKIHKGPGDKSSCVICGGEFIIKSSSQKFCEPCGNERTREQQRTSSARRYKNHPEESRKYQREWRRINDPEIKTEVLTHYGKDGCLLCCWPDCEISDLDMLSLDHINNNGKEERDRGLRGGCEGYKRLMRENFPPGFQTLCFNHQFKKEFLRKRKVWI